MHGKKDAPSSRVALLEAIEEMLLFFVRAFVNVETTENHGGHGVKRRMNLIPRKSYRTRFGSLRVAYLASLAHVNIRLGRVLTKRDVYYMCTALFPNPAFVDRALAVLATDLGVPRNDLNVVAAPRGLVSGCISFVDELGHDVNVGMFSGDGCLVPSRPERMKMVQTDACAIVVIEKEASYQSLLSERTSQELLKTCIFVTGKGYPDMATRLFLDQVSRTQKEKGKDIPIFVLTDADPHGISIAYCYIKDLPSCHVRWVGVRPSDNGSLFNVSPSAFLSVTEREIALIDGMLAEMKAEIERGVCRTAPLISELKVLKETQKKYEMEALATIEFDSGVSGLLEYLLVRTEQERASDRK